MTRADQWKVFARTIAALAAIAAITGAATIEALRIGPAAAGLLFLLPVLWVSAQAGMAAGLTGAAFAAFSYNYFLLEPRYTLRIHGPGDLAAFSVLTVVAVVTSRLASGLREREIEATQRADASAAEAALSVLLTRENDRAALDAAALAFFRQRYGEALLVRGEDLAEKRTPLAPLDAAAAAWALHHGGLSGHASDVMPSADFRFVPLARGSGDVLALATGGDPEAGPLAEALARLWVQARDRLAAAAERRAREEAEQRETVRRALLAALGHDFRTPLTVLKSGLAEMGGPEAARLEREVDRITRLSQDLIAAARLENGQPARIEPIDLIDIVAAASGARRDDAEVALAIDIADDLPLVRGDAVMLVHLIGNLIENGVRHARSRVSIVARQHDGAVELIVGDDGAGIDPAIAGSLFDRFVSGSDREGGSGLGLAIAHDLATAMGATLAAGNSAAGGACFTLRLAAFARGEAAA